MSRSGERQTVRATVTSTMWTNPAGMDGEIRLMEAVSGLSDRDGFSPGPRAISATATAGRMRGESVTPLAPRALKSHQGGIACPPDLNEDRGFVRTHLIDWRIIARDAVEQ